MVADVEAKLQKLQDTYMTATKEWYRQWKVDIFSCLAERLVSGLASGSDRWASEIDKLRDQGTMLVGDAS